MTHRERLSREYAVCNDAAEELALFHRRKQETDGIVLRGEPSADFGLSPELLTQNFDRIYLEAGVDAAALRQQLPEKFDADTRLVPIVAVPAETGSYVVKG